MSFLYAKKFLNFWHNPYMRTKPSTASSLQDADDISPTQIYNHENQSSNQEHPKYMHHRAYMNIIMDISNILQNIRAKSLIMTQLMKFLTVIRVANKEYP